MQGMKVRVFDLIQYISGPLEGKFDDWPANVQDGLMQAVEEKAQLVGLPLVIVDSACGIDYAEEEGGKDRFFVHLALSEVVAKDVGFDKRLIEETMRKINMVKETKH